MINEKADALRNLDLQGDPSPEEVGRAYRNKMKQLHPDVTDGTNEEAQRLNAARDLLTTPSNELERFQHLEATIAKQEGRLAAQTDAIRLTEVGVRRAGATLKQQQRVATIAAIAAAIITGLGQLIDKVAGESTARLAGDLSLAAVLLTVIAVLVSFGLGLKLTQMEQSIRDLDDQLSDRPYLKMCLVEILRLGTDQSVRELTNSQWNTGVERWLVALRI